VCSVSRSSLTLPSLGVLVLGLVPGIVLNASTYLSCRVYDLSSKVLSLVAYHLREGVLDSRIVTLNKVSVDIANRK
jgi:hypothetical protein